MAPRRERAAGALRAGCASCTTRPAARCELAGPTGRVRPLGRRPAAGRHPGAAAPVAVSGVERRRVGAWPPPATFARHWPSALGTAVALGPQTPRPRASGVRRRSGWPASATCSPDACSPTPSPGHGGRSPWPLAVVSKRARRVLAARRRPACAGGLGPTAAAPRPRCATSRCASSTTPPTAWVCGGARSSAARSNHSCRTSRPGPVAGALRPSPPDPIVTLTLTSTGTAWRAHVRSVLGEVRRRDRRREGQRLRLRLAPPGRRGPGPRPDRLAVGTVYELAGLPPAVVEPLVLTPGPRAPSRPRGDAS